MREKSEILESIGEKGFKISQAEEERFRIQEKVHKIKRKLEHTKIDLNFDERKLRKLLKKTEKAKKKRESRRETVNRLKLDYERLKDINTKVIKIELTFIRLKLRLR